jgi:hypothetical protein
MTHSHYSAWIMSGNVLIRQHLCSLFSLCDHQLLIRGCQHANFLRAHTFLPPCFCPVDPSLDKYSFFCGNYNPISFVYLGCLPCEKMAKRAHTYMKITSKAIPRRKIRMIECNAKCRYLKKFTCKGILRQVLYLSEAPSAPNPKLPPPNTLYVFLQYTFFTQGRGEGERAKQLER